MYAAFNRSRLLQLLQALYSRLWPNRKASSATYEIGGPLSIRPRLLGCIRGTEVTAYYCASVTPLQRRLRVHDRN